MREDYEVLTAVETQAVELFARRNPGPEELEDLQDALKDMDAALSEDDLQAWADADDRFHAALLVGCGNQRLAAIASNVRDQGHRARLLTLRLRPRPKKSNKEHRDVFNAIKKGAWERARQLHYEHRSRTSEVLLEILKSYPLPPL